jgi:hypothetical protein
MTEGGQSGRSTRPADPPRLPLSLVRRAVLYRPFDQITLSFNSFRGYRVPRHSIPPLTSVVNADLSMA